VWNVESHCTNQVVLTLSSSADTLESWPFPFLFRYTVTLSDRLEILFEHHNPHSGPVQTGGALHTYLAVSDLSAVGIPALDPLARLDKLTQQVVRSGPVRAASPIDAVFYDAPQQLQVQTGDRVVQLQQDAPDAVVWNPGADKAASMGDLGEGEHAHFVCVEAAAVRLRSLAPSATFHLRTTLSLPC
jgi:glucose-6-phosphate 1-epimerase